jgi:hypothetical protein
MKKLTLVLSILVWMGGCGGTYNVSLVTISMNQANPPSIDQGQTLQFSVSLIDDTTHKGVAWTATGPACGGSACGTFTNVTSTSATYNAPATVSSGLNVTVTATSVATPTQSAFSSFYVMPPPSIVTTNLPVATPTYIYSTTLAGSGGVPPLNWSVASGALPAGLLINNAGTIYGTPTTGGTSNFTLKVTDSSGSPAGTLSTQESLSLTVAGLLTIPAATFPAATVNVPYSTTLVANGGLLPLSWKIYIGSLPPGLALQGNTGVISGTPITAGSYSFQVEVFDSSPTQQYYIGPIFTITVNPSGPVALRTTSLMDGTVNTPYVGTLVATGGNLPLNWVITGGGLPAGLTLNSTTGVISGTPTAAPGTYPFTVEVLDSSSPRETSTESLSITINSAAAACSSSGNDSLLDGQYAFTLRGYNGGGFVAVVGSFTADGAGDITAGEADTNGVLGAQKGYLITSASSYSVGPDNRGCATLATPFGTFTTRFAVGDTTAGVATQGRIIEFDTPSPTAYIASGQMLQQNVSAFLFPLTGAYSLRTTGWDSSASGHLACVGIVAGNSFKFGYWETDCNDNGTVSNITNSLIPTGTVVNTYTAADTNGRGTGILLVNGSLLDLTFYWVSTTQLFIINSDASPTFSGDLEQEQVPTGSQGFSNASLNTTVASYSSGVGLSGAGGDVTLATDKADGVTYITNEVFRDVAGVWQTPNPATSTCPYSVVSIGLVTLGSACGADAPISYLYSLNHAFVLGTDPAVELGSLEPQTVGLTNGSVAGTYFMGTTEVVSQAAQTDVGVLTLAPNGTLTGTLDSTSTLSQTPDASPFDTFFLNANGTFSTGSSGGTVVGIAISNSKLVMVNTPTSTVPTLVVMQQ